MHDPEHVRERAMALLRRDIPRLATTSQAPGYDRSAWYQALHYLEDCGLLSGDDARTLEREAAAVWGPGWSTEDRPYLWTPTRVVNTVLLSGGALLAAYAVFAVVMGLLTMRR